MWRCDALRGRVRVAAGKGMAVLALKDQPITLDDRLYQVQRIICLIARGNLRIAAEGRIVVPEPDPQA